MRRRSGVEVSEPPRKRPRAPPPDAAELDVSFRDDEALPPGLLITDIARHTWRIGKPIGRGSFGRIYLASDDVSTEVTKQNARYVVKIEPHSNGPLFVEIHVLIRRARAAMVKEWRLNHKQKSLGMPIYITSGSFTDEATGSRYRFLVLPRYEVDLQKIIARKGGLLDLKNVLVIALQILDVLEYLHEEGYTHSDIKSSNLMLGFDGMKFGKVPTLNTASFLKDAGKTASLKHKVSPNKSNRVSSYYNDEDFVCKSGSYESAEENLVKEKRIFNVKQRMRKMLSDRASRNLHRHHAFNLRQLPSHVNYEDFNSSICSDESYQRLLDEHEGKYFSEEGFHSEPAREKLSAGSTEMENKEEMFSEAILSQSNGQIYLLDYGLASKFLEGNNHKEFGMDARKAHDGTLEYSSRDSHIGAHSRRSDLETLGFNLLDWLTGTLPWKTTEMLAEPDLVHALKKNYMEDVKALMRTCFKTEFYPGFLEKYLQYVTSLEFSEKPDYNYCRNIFKTEFMRNGFGSEKDMRLCLNETPMSPMSRKKICFSKKLGRNPIKSAGEFMVRSGIKKYGRENIQSLENDLKLELLKRTLNASNDGIRKPCASRNFFISDADLVARLKQSLLPLENLGKKLSPKNLRSKKRLIQKKRGKRNKRNSIGKFGNFLGSGRQYSWAEILAGNPEHIVKNLRKEKNAGSEEEDNTNKSRNRKVSNASDTSSPEHATVSPLHQKDYLHGRNPTYAMKEIHANFRKKMSKKPVKETENIFTNSEGYTPAMLRVIQARDRREAKERAIALKEKQKLAKGTNSVKSAEHTSRNPPKKPNPSENATKKKSVNTKPAFEMSVGTSTRACKKSVAGRNEKASNENSSKRHPRKVNSEHDVSQHSVAEPKTRSRPKNTISALTKSAAKRNNESGGSRTSTAVSTVTNKSRNGHKTATAKCKHNTKTNSAPVQINMPALSTPLRKVMNSKRKPIVRIVKVIDVSETVQENKVAEKKVKTQVSKTNEPPKSRVASKTETPTRRITRGNANKQVTRSTARKCV